MELISDTLPMITGNIAPPTIAIISKEEPSLVFDPRPRMPREKIVGNMMDIKNSTPIKAYTGNFP
jgi:hypothetical protein